MFNLPINTSSCQVFTSKGLSDFQVWNKPPDAKFVQIFCLGGGSGGGGGQAGTATTARKGGGGGASAAYSSAFFSATQIPDTLFMSIGLGGAGGVGGAVPTNGGSGAISYVSVRPDITAANLLLSSGTGTPTGGQAGASGTGGTAGSIFTRSILTNLGMSTGIAGQAGTSGAISAAAANITINNIVTGAPCGGNTTTAAAFAGGDVTGLGPIPTIAGGALGAAAATGGKGSDGYESPITLRLGKREPMFFTAGAGGGASVSGQGGRGGNGSYGCGGGGGGAGFTGLAGAGGNGGDGLILIITV